MLQKNVLSNIQGFAMVTVIVASGMVGGLALILSQLSKQQMILQKRNESWLEIEAFSRRIVRIIYNKTACLNTIQNDFDSIPIALNPGVNTVTLKYIKNSGGQSVIRQNGIYRNRLIKVSSLILKDINVVGNIGKMNLQVTLERTAKNITGYKKTVRIYPLMAKLNAANQPIDCESDLGLATAAVIRELCQELGGTYNDAGATCIPPTANKICPESSDSPQLPIGFDSSGNLQCADFPVSSEKPHPKGFNCFLLALYRGNHGQEGELFQPIDATAVATNNGDTTDVKRLKRWKINDSCPTPPAPPVPPDSAQYTCTLPVGGVNMSYALKVCPTGYTNRFINPIGAINDALIGSQKEAGAYAAFMQHFCCR